MGSHDCSSPHRHMISRRPDFLTSDVEKSWRNRKSEFEESYRIKGNARSKGERLGVSFDSNGSLRQEDLEKIICIGNEG